MADLNDPNVRIQYLVAAETSAGSFSSALYFTPDEFSKIEGDEVKKMAQAQVDAWVTFCKEESQKVSPEVKAEEAPQG